MNILKKKEGFTLVEMLIVIFIIAMLSTLAINGYTEYRRTALLDFAADSFTAQFYGLRDSTLHGDFGSVEYETITLAIESGDPYFVTEESEASCFGYYLNIDGGDYTIQKFEITYNSQLEFEEGEWVRGRCEFGELNDATLTETVYSDLGLDEEVSVVRIYDREDGFDLSSDIAITFIPPSGEIYIYPNTAALDAIGIEMKYGKSEQDKYKRNIFIDLASGQVNVTRSDYVGTPA
jgi:prepilin-type N-terminal cleavage/methylation domain-containing protein